MNVQQITAAVKSIFGVLGRVRTVYNQEYNLDRAIDLTECIARDFDNKLKRVLSERPIMQIPY